MKKYQEIRLNTIKRSFESYIREQYRSFDGGHNEEHLQEVLDFGTDIYNRLNDDSIDYSVLWIILAGHDLGLRYGRKDHQLNSAKIISDMLHNKGIFSCQEIDLICTAIIEHRTKNTATSVYAEILKDADKASLRDYDRTLERVMKKNFLKVQKNNPDMPITELKELVVDEAYSIFQSGDKHRHHYIMEINKDIPIVIWEDITKDELRKYYDKHFIK